MDPNTTIETQAIRRPVPNGPPAAPNAAAVFTPAEPRPTAPMPAGGNGRPRSAGPQCPKCRSVVSKELKECPHCQTLLFFGTESADDRMERIRGYNLGQVLLREREYLFEAIHRETGLDAMVRYFAAYAYLFAAVYGAFLGTYSSWMQIPTVAGKVPLLLFGTLVICAPALFTFNVLLGSKLTVRQTVAMLVVATYLTSAVLVSLAPIVFFFIISGSSRDFVLLLNVIACAIAGGFGISLLWGGMKYLTIKSGNEPDLAILKVWSLIYVFVGTQLAWTLRPFVGDKGAFALYRHLEGNFYTAVFNLIGRLLGQ